MVTAATERPAVVVRAAVRAAVSRCALPTCTFHCMPCSRLRRSSAENTSCRPRQAAQRCSRFGSRRRKPTSQRAECSLW